MDQSNILSIIIDVQLKKATKIGILKQGNSAYTLYSMVGED